MRHSLQVSDRTPSEPSHLTVLRDKKVLTMVGIGALLRVLSLLLLAPAELDPDAGQYLNLAKQFDWSQPWAASAREPLFVGLTKLVSAPFGYSSVAPRVMTTVASTLVVLVSVLFFYKVLPPRTAAVAGFAVAANGLLIFLAPRGLREDLSLVLIMWVALLLVTEGRTPLRKATLIALALAGLAGIRWELAVFALVALAIVSVWRSWLRSLVLLSLVSVSLVSGPWLVANAHHYDDPLYHAVYSATWFRDREFDPPDDDPQQFLTGPDITWGEYYLDFLGPAETSRRLLTGVPSLAFDLTYQWVLPVRHERFVEFHPQASKVLSPLRVIAAILASVFLALCLIGAFVGRRAKALQAAAGVTLAGWFLYAPVERFLVGNYRLVSFTVPFQAMLLATGLVWLIDRRAALSRPKLPSDPST